MNLILSSLIAVLPVAAAAQSRSVAASGVPGVAIPKVTAVLVIQTAKQGVTAEQVMAVMPSEIRAHREALPRGNDPPMVFARRR